MVNNIDAAMLGMSRALDPVGYMSEWPEFHVETRRFNGDICIEYGYIDGWRVARTSRGGVPIGEAILAYSSEWFLLKEWGIISLEDIMPVYPEEVA